MCFDMQYLYVLHKDIYKGTLILFIQLSFQLLHLCMHIIPKYDDHRQMLFQTFACDLVIFILETNNNTVVFMAA